jgi:hypothetical protein
VLCLIPVWQAALKRTVSALADGRDRLTVLRQEKLRALEGRVHARSSAAADGTRRNIEPGMDPARAEHGSPLPIRPAADHAPSDIGCPLESGPTLWGSGCGFE